MAVVTEERPMTSVPREPVVTPAAWKGADLAGTDDWLYKISETMSLFFMWFFAMISRSFSLKKLYALALVLIWTLAAISLGSDVAVAYQMDPAASYHLQGSQELKGMSMNSSLPIPAAEDSIDQHMFTIPLQRDEKPHGSEFIIAVGDGDGGDAGDAGDAGYDDSDELAAETEAERAERLKRERIAKRKRKLELDFIKQRKASKDGLNWYLKRKSRLRRLYNRMIAKNQNGIRLLLAKYIVGGDAYAKRILAIFNYWDFEKLVKDKLSDTYELNYFLLQVAREDWRFLN